MNIDGEMMNGLYIIPEIFLKKCYRKLIILEGLNSDLIINLSCNSIINFKF